MKYVIVPVCVIAMSFLFTSAAYSQSEEIPNWIKDVAGFWAEGKISDDEFLKGIEFLIANKILLVSDTSMEELKQSKYHGDVEINMDLP